MANGKYEWAEVRFVVESELTQAYVLLRELEHCDGLVQGWHHKTFPASKSVLDILTEMATSDNPLMWPRNAPK